MTDEELRLARQPGGLIALVHRRFPLVAFVDRTALLAYDADGRVVPEATTYLRGLLPKGAA